MADPAAISGSRRAKNVPFLRGKSRATREGTRLRMLLSVARESLKGELIVSADSTRSTSSPLPLPRGRGSEEESEPCGKPERRGKGTGEGVDTRSEEEPLRQQQSPYWSPSKKLLFVTDMHSSNDDVHSQGEKPRERRRFRPLPKSGTKKRRAERGGRGRSGLYHWHSQINLVFRLFCASQLIRGGGEKQDCLSPPALRLLLADAVVC